MESGIYIRVGSENKLLEELDTEARQEWLENLDRDGLLRTIEILCRALNNKDEDDE